MGFESALKFVGAVAGFSQELEREGSQKMRKVIWCRKTQDSRSGGL